MTSIHSTPNVYVAKPLSTHHKVNSNNDYVNGTSEPSPVISKVEEGDDSSIKSFTYGALGFDNPSEAHDCKCENDSEDTAYSAGKFMKGLGTIGSIIAILV